MLPPIPKKGRSAVGISAAAALMLAGLIPIGTITAPAAAAAPGVGLTMTSADLSVVVAEDFPQVVSYQDLASGAVLSGRTEELTKVTINNVAQDVTVTSAPDGTSAVNYNLTVPALAGVEIDARLKVENRIVTFEVTRIADTATNRVASIEIPNHNLVSVSSSDPGATVATAKLSVDRGASGDTFTEVTTSTPLNANRLGSTYALANTEGIAAALETNATVDTANAANAGNQDGGRFFRQAVADGDGVRVGVSSGSWLHRPDGAATPEGLPWAKVAITGDANGDAAVDWQDAAIALRTISLDPNRADEVPNRVIAHIPFNFASQATHPFLRTLDDVKRISLATDGLGQLALLKGYGSEGHDSAHPDFGGNYNTRAGGLEGLNALLEQGEDWNATFGVHVNATESYPEAKAFDEKLVDKSAKGWNWLDQSYYMNQRYDTNSGELEKRFGQLRAETHKNLSFVYVDVYYTHGWISEQIQQILVDQGFQVGTEWADKLEHQSTWSHWASDENYGPKSNKGINSEIIRFARNHEKDVWNPHPLLGNAQIIDFEGWTGQIDWNKFYNNIWKQNLPAKFLQHQEIMKWGATQIDLTNGVSVTGTNAADRKITVDGVKVLDGDNYLLPWNPNTPDKLYHYNPTGGSTTWQLTPQFAAQSALSMYKLTTTGREKVADVPVTGGSVTVAAEAGQPYVLAADGVDANIPATANWGSDTKVVDPGFNAKTLDAWNPTGEAKIFTTTTGQRVAQFGTGESSISQELGALSAGTYSISAWAEIETGKARDTTMSVEVPGQPTITKTFDRSGARNWVAADEKHSTNYQRVRVLVDVPEGAKPKLTVSAAANDATVRLDDVRIIRTERVPTTGVFSEDFENIDQGWGPFMKGNAGGITDPRTHLAELNAPYTQKGWNQKSVDDVIEGTWSLKSHEENGGLVYRTSDYTLPLTPGHKYQVSFDYQASVADQYAWITGYDAVAGARETRSTSIPQQLETTRFSEIVEAGGCGQAWVGLKRVGGSAGSEFILDNLLVEDLGVSDDTPACASLTVKQTGDVVEQGKANRFTTALTSDETADVKDVDVSLELPAGWTATAVDPATAETLAPNGTLTTRWDVTPPVEADGKFDVTAKVNYTTTTAPPGNRTTSATIPVWTTPTPPKVSSWASDLMWTKATNGWGPVERDQANGEQDQNDGPPMTMAGKVYAKGIGAHAVSNVTFYLGGQCTAFTSHVGIDDTKARAPASITFAVLADDTKVYETPTILPGKYEDLNVDITGADYVTLNVGDSGNGNGNDWGDWGDAKFWCGGDSPNPDPDPIRVLEVVKDTVVRGDDVEFNYATNEADGPKANWIGIYPIDGSCRPVDQVYVCGSSAWKTAVGPSGTSKISTTGLPGGEYVAYYMWNDDYKWLATPVTFTVTDPSVPPKFVTDSFRTRNIRVGDTLNESIAGLYRHPTAPPAFTKVSGADWITVAADGMLGGAAPTAGDHELVVAAGALTLKVTVPVVAADAPMVDSLKAMSANLWYGGTQVDDYRNKQLKAIIDADVDVVGFQESYSTSGKELAEALGWDYFQAGYDHSVISRYPITERSEPQEASGMAGSGVRILLDEFENQELIFWTSHLWYTPMGPELACFDGKTPDELIAAESRRLGEAKEIVEMMNDWRGVTDTPAILVGDFNAPSHRDWTKAAEASHCGYSGIEWPATKAVEDAGFTDSFREIHPDPVAKPGNTWSPIIKTNGNGKPEPQDRIDFVFYQGEALEASASDTYVVGTPELIGSHKKNEWTSDHAWVVTDFNVTLKAPDTQPDPEAKISLSVAEAAVGDTVAVSGSGFAAGESVGVVLGDGGVSLATGTADSSGVLAVSFTVPVGAAVGATEVVATGAVSALVARAPLTVKPAVVPAEAKISLSVAEAAIGDTVAVSGSGFAAGESVGVVLSAGGVSLATGMADTSGVLAVSFTVPVGATVGATEVVATGAVSALVARAPLTVKPAVVPAEAKITISATEAAIGDTVDVTGTGFTAGETVTVELHSDPILLATGTADASGNLAMSFTVPAAATVGAHEVVATGGASALTARTPLTVKAAVTPPEPGVDPTTPPTTAPGVTPTVPPTAGGKLPLTGLDVLPLIFMGFAFMALGLGTTALIIRRRRESESIS